MIPCYHGTVLPLQLYSNKQSLCPVPGVPLGTPLGPPKTIRVFCFCASCKRESKVVACLSARPVTFVLIYVLCPSRSAALLASTKQVVGAPLFP